MEGFCSGGGSGGGGGGGDGIGDGSGFDILSLPDLCISHIISLTSPPDACNSAAVCTAFLSAVDSDTVWERLLPPDYQSILDRASEPIEYSSKRELFRKLCLRHILIDNGLMSFKLCRSTGAKWIMLSAKLLNFPLADDPNKWRLIACENSRFSEVAQVLFGRLLKISVRIESRVLSPKTTYAAVLIYKYKLFSLRISKTPQEATVGVGSRLSKRKLCLGCNGIRKKYKRGTADNQTNTETDWWLEVELGKFYNDDGENEVKISLKGKQILLPEFLIHGIELRPIKSKPLSPCLQDFTAHMNIEDAK